MTRDIASFTVLRRNPKNQWRIIKEASGLPLSNNETVDSIFVNGERINDQSTIADEFNNHFANIGVKTSSSVPDSDISFKDFLPPATLNSMFFQPILREQILEVINLLDNKSSLDYNDLSISLLKFVSNEVVVPLEHIFNISIEQGTFPEGLKVSKTVPIYKGSDAGSATDLGNYRPISMINTFSKVFEKIISLNLLSFLNNNNFFNENQFGFRKERNTFHAVLSMVNYISEGLKENSFVAACFLDISKAFDSVRHDILLEKLEHYGIRGIVLSWFKSYLSGRTQKVKVNDVWSQVFCNISIGVLQGSILGVLLFLIFVNDLLGNNVSNFYKVTFADDTTALIKHDSLDILQDLCNTELNSLSQWFTSNKLLLNAKKSKFIIFSPKNNINVNLDLLINNVTLTQIPNEKEKSVRCLGFYIDEKLNLKDHIKKVSHKISKSIFFLSRAKNIVGLDTLKLLYYCRVHSHLLYCLPLISMATKTDRKCLLLLQKKALRIIYNKNRQEHCDPLFHDMGILSVENQILFEISKFMHFLKYYSKPVYFIDAWILNNNRNIHYNLRRTEDFFIPLIRNATILRKPLYFFASTWNSLDPAVSQEAERKIFINKLKAHFFSQLDYINCTKPGCLTCQFLN